MIVSGSGYRLRRLELILVRARVLANLDAAAVRGQLLLGVLSVPHDYVLLALRPAVEVLELSELVLVGNHDAVHALLGQFAIRGLPFGSKGDTARVLRFVATSSFLVQGLVR